MGKKKIRVRSKRLDQIDDTKLSLALYLIARDIVEPQLTSPPDTPKHSGPVEHSEESS